jgi:hypothetical protein
MYAYIPVISYQTFNDVTIHGPDPTIFSWCRKPLGVAAKGPGTFLVVFTRRIHNGLTDGEIIVMRWRRGSFPNLILFR